MSKLRLSVAVGAYDRMRPLIDGEVGIEGVDPTFITLEPEEIFFRAFRHAEFDICELSLSSFCVRTARGDNPYVGVPVFPSRAFRHTAISVRTDRIERPEDLRGKRVGVPEWQLTACVWARAILQDDFGVGPAEIEWVRGGLEQPGREEKIPLDLPPAIRIRAAPAGATLSAMLEAGEIDGIIAPRIPSCQARGAPNVGWLFRDPQAAATDYYRRTGIFPIMHVLGVRRALAEAQPWLAASALKAFMASKAIAFARLADASAAKVGLPFVEEQVARTRALMGDDWWPYGVEKNRKVLETFLGHHHAQGLSDRRLAVEDLFAASTLEAARI